MQVGLTLPTYRRFADRSHIEATADPVLAALIDELEAYPCPRDAVHVSTVGKYAGIAVPLRLRVGPGGCARVRALRYVVMFVSTRRAAERATCNHDGLVRLRRDRTWTRSTCEWHRHPLTKVELRSGCARRGRASGPSYVLRTVHVRTAPQMLNGRHLAHGMRRRAVARRPAGLAYHVTVM